jgi:ATP-dependent Lhr-like helicase
VRAIDAVLRGGDVVIAAPTAGGKTEAAFLPLASRLAEAGGQIGFGLLYISPLKALINDQFSRLEPLFETLDLPVHRWHGDVAASSKAKARKKPQGLVLITPESLEALFVLRGREIPHLFGSLQAVVIDELHNFVGTERGAQLASLLTRIELATGRRVDRVGLSATLGDLTLAAEALRRGEGSRVEIVEGKGETALKAQVRGYWRERPLPGATPETASQLWKRAIADHLFDTLRLGKNLAFAGSRDNVEEITDLLCQRTEAEGLPEAFYAHHGNLSREHREFVEARLKDANRPATGVCTSTLELGIDIGAIDAVAQIGPPFTVSSLRQRLGRSGRRAGKSAILRVYVDEPRPDQRSGLIDGLNFKLLQSIAMLRLLTARWCEPPVLGGLHLSTLTQQMLAVIAERGGAHASVLYDVLCQKGPFRSVTRAVFVDVLRAISREEVGLIEQAPDRLLLLGPMGEQIVARYDFFAVFSTPEEFRVVAGDQDIGRLSMEFTRAPEDLVLLAGRRWKIETIDDRAKIIQVVPSRGALPPGFQGGVGGIHDRVAREVRALLDDDVTPPFLDAVALEMLQSSRETYAKLQGGEVQWAIDGGKIYLFPWVGHRKLETLSAALKWAGIDAGKEGLALRLEEPPTSSKLSGFKTFTASTPPAEALAGNIEPRIREKYHQYLTDDLLILELASQVIDLEGLAHLVPLACSAIGGACDALVGRR